MVGCSAVGCSNNSNDKTLRFIIQVHRGESYPNPSIPDIPQNIAPMVNSDKDEPIKCTKSRFSL